MEKEKKKPDYRLGYKYLLNHIEELEERLDQKDNLIERMFYYWIDRHNLRYNIRSNYYRKPKLSSNYTWKFIRYAAFLWGSLLFINIAIRY